MTNVIPMLPVSIRYPLNERLPDGTLFKVLHTFEELDKSWRALRGEFSYIARGRRCGKRQVFLRPGEWFFAYDIPALVRAVTRWEAMGLRAEWTPSSSALSHESHLRELMRAREIAIETGRWGGDAERMLMRRLGRIEQGRWQLKLPVSLRSHSWFSQCEDELPYATLTAAQAAEIFQMRTYEDWRLSVMRDVDFMSADELDELMQTWRTSLSYRR
jgi:hypothetical protein